VSVFSLARVMPLSSPRTTVKITNICLWHSKTFHHSDFVRPFHHSQPLQLRKPPQSRHKVFGMDLTWIPWPGRGFTEYLKAVVRRRYTPEMFGQTEDIRKNIFHRLGKLYALLVWTMLGVIVYSYNKGPQINVETTPKKELPNQKEIDEGGAFYYMTQLRTSEDVGDKEQVVFRVKGFSIEKEDVTEKVRETITAQEEEIAFNSDDMFLRKRLNLPLTRKEMSDDQVKEKIAEMGLDYEWEMDRAKQQGSKNPWRTRTIEELEQDDRLDAQIGLRWRKFKAIKDAMIDRLFEKHPEWEEAQSSDDLLTSEGEKQ